MLSLSILLLLAFGLVCSAHPLEKRQSRPTDSFKLYAYGPGISGLPVFYRNGTAEVADASKVDTTTMAAMTPVNFTASSDNTWVAHPSSSTSSTEGFSTISTNTNKLCLDRGNTDSNPVGFTGTSTTEQSNTTKLSNVWSTYGGYVLVTVSGANFYARPTGTDGLYSLLWSSSAEAMTDTIPLVLRTAEPATVSVLT
ncbi:hypothetical protein N7471_000903 [Penicillium samsonianum]|uniref:uncharacterized protein n=1 Tax=Penicillium samsonianum TaxID=1882272 RepID=UPI00254984C6|nr:uncharacterized protein N7471_000903 [Penicillium samsonianum]KAJ6149704.1 hypothetical protein N7471_000903 [Penicillium samsonianum]